jgi:hypothetical protein
MIMPSWVYRQKSEIRKQGTNGRGEKFDKLVSTTLCRIDPSEGIVKLPDGSTKVKTAMGWFPYGTPIERDDVVISKGLTYVVHKVTPIPAFVGYSHKEVILGE